MSSAFQISLMGKDEINKGAHLEWMARKPRIKHRFREFFEVKPEIIDDASEPDIPKIMIGFKTLYCAVIERACLDLKRKNICISCTPKKRQEKLEKLVQYDAIDFFKNGRLGKFIKMSRLDLNPNYIKKMLIKTHNSTNKRNRVL